MAESGGVAESLLERCRLPDGDVLVALSGGADSAVAAWVAQRLATGSVHAAFIDHGLSTSADMAVAAARVAAHLGLDLRNWRVFVPSGPSPEEQARTLRLTLLQGLAPGWVVTGHTADDRVETLLLNLLRGSGARGIASIRERRDRFVRPLLAVRRYEVRLAAEELSIPYVDDPANLDLAHARNRIRHLLLPQLESEWNPRLTETLLRTADAVAADDAFLDDVAGRLGALERRVPAALVSTAPDALAARFVRQWLQAVRNPDPPSARDVAAVRAVAAGAVARSALERDWEVLREGPYLVVRAKVPPEGVSPAVLEVPGRVGFAGWELWAEAVSGDPPVILGAHRALVDGSRDDLTVRGAAEGDRIDMGDTGRKRVFEALAEAGVAPHLRPGWPVVESDGRIVWLAGVRVAAWAVPTGTDQILLSSRRESK